MVGIWGLERTTRELTAGLVLVMLLAGCGAKDKSGEFYSSWDLDGGCTSAMPAAERVDATGRRSDPCEAAEGGWVWVTYAAGWCSSSRNQAPAVSRLAQSVGPDVTVYTVLTASDDVFVPARIDDARSWAASHGFAPQRVLYDAEKDTRIIPQHLLIGPDGKTWYRYNGQLNTEQMQQLLADFASGRRKPNVRQLAQR
jgi:hypothetical protein